MSIGDTIGPVFAGVLTYYFGYSVSVIILTGLGITSGFLYALVWLMLKTTNDKAKDDKFIELDTNFI